MRIERANSFDAHDLNIQPVELKTEIANTQPIIFEEVFVKDSDNELVQILQSTNDIIIEEKLQQSKRSMQSKV